jgi:hypothetical protein
LIVSLTGIQGDLKTNIADQGGFYAAKVTDDCTHLVANQKQYDAKGAKGELHNLLPSPCSESCVSYQSPEYLLRWANLFSNPPLQILLNYFSGPLF